MFRKERMLEKAVQKYNLEVSPRRYALSDLISESYSALYQCKEGTKMRSLVESHIQSIKDNPREIEKLSYSLSAIKSLLESEHIDDEELEDCDMPKKRFVAENTHDEDVEEVEESKHDEDVEEVDENTHDEDVEEIEECGDEELTQEELDELSKHLKAFRESKKKMKEAATAGAPRKGIKVVRESASRKGIKVVRESKKSLREDAPLSRFRIFDKVNKEVIDSYTEKKDAEEWIKQLVKDGDFKRGDLEIIDGLEKTNESKWASINLEEFSKNSSSKAFYKTLKKMNESLREGKALTRQESIALYKATNSAMTHLSVELEHNPEFLESFSECTKLLSKDVSDILAALREGKAPSKKTMKSLAEFSDTLLTKRNQEDDEELMEDEEDEVIDPEIEEETMSPEAEEFFQDYADAREEAHEEIAEKYEDSEDPTVQDAIAADAAEVAELKGEDVEEPAEDTEETPEDSEEEVQESEHDEDVEELEEKDEEEEEKPAEPEVEDDFEDDAEITDDELAELKRHLKEMRRIKSK